MSALATRTWADAFGGSVDAADEAAELDAGRSEAYFAETVRDRAVLVAEEDGALVGYVQAGGVEIDGVEPAPGDASLQRLYVDAPWQGRGLGRALVDEALRTPPLAAASRVWLSVCERNERALRLYERSGFDVVGTTRLAIGGSCVEDLVMRLDRGAGS